MSLACFRIFIDDDDDDDDIGGGGNTIVVGHYRSVHAYHRRQSFGVHGVRTPPERRGREKKKGLEGGERKGESEGRKGLLLPDFYLD